tara:strand:- start:352 stop:927 length:576 start_codon:yes stop_codon:yes gene_type:complete
MPSFSVNVIPSQKEIVLKIVDEDKVISKFTLKAKKSFDGNIMIYDHDDVDIIVMPEKKKVVTFRKERITGDIAYGAADRLFRYLASRGIISLDSVQGAGTLSSYEATILETDIKIPIKLTLLAISKWIDEERPYFEYGEDYEEMMKDRLLEPDHQESTELGEVPQDKSKGSIVPGYYRSPYWMSYILEQKE